MFLLLLLFFLPLSIPLILLFPFTELRVVELDKSKREKSHIALDSVAFPTLIDEWVGLKSLLFFTKLFRCICMKMSVNQSCLVNTAAVARLAGLTTKQHRRKSRHFYDMGT
uniref:Secreted protein n=1 Tax=Lygus hesperus TaxID=30085 RepID=A0A146L9N7_LYGHE